MGMLPRVGSPPAPPIAGYPDARRAAVVFSADLELAWAWRYSKSGGADPLADARRRARAARRNMPALLTLFDRYRVPVTWATVGHLFLEGCERVGGLAHPELPRVPHFQNEYWRYRKGDWFDADPCCLAEAAPAWYAPDLVRAILDAEAGHEVACHTFSHVPFSDDACPSTVARAELEACQRAAARWGVALRTLVFPADLPGNLGEVARAGFAAYRAWTGSELDWPRRDAHGTWRIPNGVCLEKPNPHWTDDAWVAALCRVVDRAVEVGAVCSLWFHPSTDSETVHRVLPLLLDYLRQRSADLWVTTIAGLTTHV